MDHTEYQKYFDANKSLWNGKTPVHKDSEFYDVDGFLKGKTTLNEIELDALGDIKGKKILHLQCHFGLDSLSLSRLGAKVTGIDFSEAAINVANELNDKAGLDAQFHCCNVYEVSKIIQNKFDIIYTSYGVLVWLPDLNKWANTIFEKLEPGGFFYIVEFHPVLMMLDDDNNLKYDYFNKSEPVEEMIEGTYTDRNADLKHVEYCWSHGLAEVFNAIKSAGLQIHDFNEYNYSPYNCFANMKELEPQKYVVDLPSNVPHLFSFKAIRSQ